MKYLKRFENFKKPNIAYVDEGHKEKRIEKMGDYRDINKDLEEKDDNSSNSYENEFEQQPEEEEEENQTNEDIKTLDKQGLRQWMEHYHDLWLKNHHKTIQIEKVLEKDISDKEKLNEIQSLINELRASYSFFKKT